MAVITLSYQPGSKGDVIGREVAARTGFVLITPEKLSDTIQKRYQLDYDLEAGHRLSQKGPETTKLVAGLVSALLADMSLLNHLVILGCGGHLIFKSFPNALHVRIIAPKEVRAGNITHEQGIASEQALRMIEEQDRQYKRFLQAGFRIPGETPERFDLGINTAELETDAAVEIILCAARQKKLDAYGMVSDERIERLKVRNQIRLQKALTQLSLETNPSLNQFAHPSELLFSRLMDFYGIRWKYEPKTFPLRFDQEGNIVEAFSPDFYLPDSDLFVELTTMKQSLVTKKNRKVKLLRELHPDIRIQLLYQKDFEDLLFKYAVNDPKRNGEKE